MGSIPTHGAMSLIRIEDVDNLIISAIEATDDDRIPAGPQDSVWDKIYEALNALRSMAREAEVVEKPYLETSYVKRTFQGYNKKYGDDRICQCGHNYYRHFDTYENMEPVGCKYCSCDTFEEIKNVTP